MTLTNQQEEGLKIAVSRYKAGEPYTVISGFAGSGKSTLVKFIISALNLNDEQVEYVAYTGKAAKVLRDYGCRNAKTAHKLLYYAQRRKNGTFKFIPKKSLDGNPKLIVVDEVSMLPQDMWKLLLSHGVPVIALGDPAQLSPVAGNSHVLDKPHVFLSEIIRQAQESEIIRLSMDVREGRSLKPFKGNEVQVISKRDIKEGMYTWADIVICATNRKRFELNNKIRKIIFGFKDDNHQPVEGDKVICLHNNYDILSMDENNMLINGAIGTISNISLHNTYLYKPRMVADFLPDEYETMAGLFSQVHMDYGRFITGEDTVTPETFIKYKADLPESFDFGYAITCWKAQGSEYDKVLLFEEGFPRDREEHKRYIYTGITRAKQRLVLVRN